jgi:hypothetical protein
MDETTIFSVRSFGVEHAIVSDAALTAEEFIRYAVSLAKSQGYILSNVEEALDIALHEVRDELRVLTK